MKTPLLSSLIFVFLLTAAPLAPLPAASAESVIERSIEATGGKEAMLAIQSRRYRYLLKMPGLNQSASMELIQEAPDKLYTKTVMPVPGMGPENNMEIEMVFNGTEGWMRDPVAGIRRLTEAEIESSQVQSDFYLLLDFNERYPDAEYLGESEYYGRNVEGIRTRGPGGEPATFYFEKETGLLIGAEMMAIQQGAQIPMNMEFKDFREEDGVLVPYEMVVHNPVFEMIFEVISIRHNVEVEEGLFDLPAELK